VTFFTIAQEIARIDTVGKPFSATLGVEDRDRADDRIQRVSGDGDADVALWVEQFQVREVLVEQRQHLGPAPRLAGASSLLLTLGEVAERMTCLLDLLGRRRGRIQVHARATTAVLARAMVGRTRPDLGDETEEAACEVARPLVRVEHERRQHLREEAECSFDVRFVLRPLEGRAHPERVAERCIDLWCVVGRLVVEQQRKGRCAGGFDTTREGLDDRRAVLVVAHRHANEGTGAGVHVELEVEDEALAIDDDWHRHPVAHPLRAREPGTERATQRELIGAAARAARRSAPAVYREDVSHEVTSEGHVEVALHVLAEVQEAAVPA
jgi:hypothetical protein